MVSENNNSILLESGTNELEVLVFQVGAYRLGINVAKVREILQQQNITSLPSCHPAVMGCFRLRDQVVSCVSLHAKFQQKQSESSERKLILTEFNQYQTAFYADYVERIYRISWEKILPVPPYLLKHKSPMTGVTVLNGELVIMLDFESIAAEISQKTVQQTAVENSLNVDRSTLRVVITDDSPTVRAAAKETLLANGYNEVVAFSDGREAWNWISSEFSKTGAPHKVAGALVSDVEMPSMDGFHLTKRIKEHPQLQFLPVILYSSILTPDNRKKGEAVGADAQVTKPEIGTVVETIDRLAVESIQHWNKEVERQRAMKNTPTLAPVSSPPISNAQVSNL